MKLEFYTFNQNFKDENQEIPKVPLQQLFNLTGETLLIREMKK